MSTKLKALLVEDSEDDALLVLRELRREGYDVTHTRVDTREGMLAALEEPGWEIILSDFAMPKFNGLGALEVYKEKGLDIPFIVISGTIGEATAVAMMKAGAHDYLMKDSLTRLAPAIERELRETQVRRKRRQTETELRDSEALFRTIVETAPCMLLIFNPNIPVNLYASPNCFEYTGYSQDEIINHFPWWVHEDDSEAAKRVLNISFEEGKIVHNFEYKGVKKNREIWYASVSQKPYHDEKGNVIGIVSQTIDISEKVKAENELRKLNRALMVTTECNQSVVRATDEKALLKRVCEIITDTGGYNLAWIGFLSPGTDEIQQVVYHGIDERIGEIFQGSGGKYCLLSGPVSQAVELLTPIIITDILADERWAECHEDARRVSLGSMIALPLVFEKTVFGGLAIFANKADFFDEDEVTLLKEMADDLAYGIHSLRVRAEARISALMLEQSNAELALAYDATLEGWSHALELRERETAGHSQRVVSLTLGLSKLLGIMDEDLVHIRRGALLHDIGKMGIPDSILLKPGKLTDEEWIVMRQHPMYAYQLLASIPYLLPAMDIPYYHHERWDGSGYPRGLIGKEIPLAARIFTVVDVWDALTSDRPYRPAWPAADAYNYLRAQSGKQFDSTVVEAFFKIVEST
jgi:PAS domain S-box-containing protein